MRELYQQILDAWNGGSEREFAAPFADDGVVIGFDGSRYVGRAEIENELEALTDELRAELRG